MAELVLIYDHPTDPAAFEDYYANRHLPLAGEKMPGVRAATTYRVLASADGAPAPYHRVAVMSYDSVDAMREAVGSVGGREVLADVPNFATGGHVALLCESEG